MSYSHLASCIARLSIFSSSRFVVGSSSVKIPQLRQNVSASASLMMSDARTFWPALHLPRMSSATLSFNITTYRICRNIITVSVKKVAAKNRSCERALNYLPCSYSFFEMLWKKLPRPHQNIFQWCRYLQSTIGYSWRPKSWLSFSTANNVCCWFSTRDTKLFAKHFWISLLDDIIQK